MKEKISIYKEIRERTRRLNEIVCYGRVPDLSKGIPEVKILTEREEADLMKLLDEIDELRKELEQLSQRNPT